jgi:hypothetical protein
MTAQPGCGYGSWTVGPASSSQAIPYHSLSETQALYSGYCLFPDRGLNVIGLSASKEQLVRGLLLSSHRSTQRASRGVPPTP